MGCREGQLLRSARRPFSWLRFMDDIDMKWSHGCETLTAFLDEANNFNPSVKFKAEISNEQTDISGHQIKASWRYNICWYLYNYPQVAARNAAAKNIPLSLALRPKRICFDSDTFESKANELTDHLYKRGIRNRQFYLLLREHYNRTV